MSDPVLQLRGVRRDYVTGRNVLHVLQGADLDIYPGELVGLIGPSGSGKSSLLHAAGLLERPTAGRVYLGGQVPPIAPESLIGFEQVWPTRDEPVVVRPWLVGDGD